MDSPYRIAVIASHPVPYQVPLWAEMGKLPEVELTVFYCDASPPEWPTDLLDGYQYSFLRNWANRSQKGFLRRINPGLFGAIYRSRFDAVVLQSWDNLSSWIAFWAAKIGGIPLVFRGEAIRTAGSSGWRHKLKSWLMSWYLRQFIAILFTCEGNHEYMRFYGVPENRLFYSPCAVDNERFQRERCKLAPHRSKVRADLGIHSDSLVVIMVAQFRALKNHMHLVEAARRLAASRGPKMDFILIGTGSEYQRVTDFVEQNCLHNVHLMGFQPYDSISKFLAIADVGVMLSDWDPSPKALNEMLNFALPVICTDSIGTSRDFVREGENGYLIGVGDIDLLTRHLRTLAENPALVACMGKRSLEIVSEATFDKAAVALLSAIQSI